MIRKRHFDRAGVQGMVTGFMLLMVTSSCTQGNGVVRDALQRPPPGCVVLVHGLGRSGRCMEKLARGLTDQGYAVVNLDYPSTRFDIETLSRSVLAPAVDRCRSAHPNAPVHFVTHSLGGILVRQYLQRHRLPPGSRVVMLSPPNRGSEVADLLNDFFLYRWLMGPAGQQLGTTPDSVPNRLEPVDVPVGVIAGDRSLEPWFSLKIPGPDDGKVSVARARLKEMVDFLVVHRTHAFIMNAPEVVAQSVHFLKTGRFKKTGS